MWSKIIKFAGKYGKKAVTWCWNNKRKLLSLAIAAYDLITAIWG